MAEASNNPTARQVDIGVITIDAHGRIVFASPHARHILRRKEPLEGAEIHDVLVLPMSFAKLLGGRLERRWSQWFRAADDDLEIDITVTPVTLENGNGLTLVIYDRTREKHLETEHRRLEHLAAMGTMVAGFAHEIRNPMASLRLIVESLAEDLAESQAHIPHLGRMLEVLERVERLVRNSLLFGRPTPSRRAAHRPQNIIANTISALRPRTHTHGESIQVEAPDDLPGVFVDEGQLVQVLVILLNNALDVTNDPRRVLLRVRHAGRPDRTERASEPPSVTFLRFEVHDDGPGIPDENVRRIFDPFFTTKASGTGLGLSIAQHLVTENGGHIELTTAVGGPTAFSVLVPSAFTEKTDVGPL